MTNMRDYIGKKRRGNPKEPPPDERERLIRDIREVRQQLEGIHSFFSMESDEDLLDAAIYQREALQARYRYLLRLARESNAAAAVLPVESEKRARWIS